METRIKDLGKPNEKKLKLNYKHIKECCWCNLLATLFISKFHVMLIKIILKPILIILFNVCNIIGFLFIKGGYYDESREKFKWR